MVIITVIMVIIMVLCLGIGLQGIKISEIQTNAGNQPSCQVVKFDSLGHAEQLLFSCLCLLFSCHVFICYSLECAVGDSTEASNSRILVDLGHQKPLHNLHIYFSFTKKPSSVLQNGT